MKVLILTSKPHWKFINEQIKEHYGHDFWISEATTFPNEYDVGISFMHLGKVPAEQVNTHKWYNFHPGPLPAYKGRNLCYHAIMNGETEFGASLHYMDENFDTGPIIDVWHFDIAPHQTAESVYRDTINTAKGLFEEYFPMILEDFPFATSSNEGGTYYKKERIEDTLWVADYSSAEFLKKQIRAIYFPPYYPKIEIGGLKYKIVRDE